MVRVWLCPLSKVNLAENSRDNSNKGNVGSALRTNWNKICSGNVSEHKRVMLDELQENLLNSGSVTRSLQKK